MNTLQRIVLRHPEWFGLEWVEVDEFFSSEEPGRGIDVKTICQIRGPWYFVEDAES